MSCALSINQTFVDWTKPSTQALDNLSSPQCKSGASLRGTTERLIREGRHFASSPAKYMGMVFSFVHGTLKQLPAKVVDDAGAVVATAQAKDLTKV